LKEKDQWQGLKTVAMIKREQQIHNLPKQDSLYKVFFFFEDFKFFFNNKKNYSP